MRLRPEQLRHSLRTLSRHKRFTALAILSLAVAIALNTTMYSVLDAIMNPRIAMQAPERLYWLTYYGDYRHLIPTSERNLAVRDGLAFHDGAAGATGGGFERIVERGNRLREARILTVTPNYFALLGVKPSAGRLLAESDLGQGVRAVVLGERMWKQLFPEKDEFEPSVVLVNGDPRRVVGLLPYAADFPGHYTDVWQLPAGGDVGQMTLSLVRLKPGATLAQAQAELYVVSLRYRQRTNEGTDAGYRLESAIRPPFRPWRFHWALIGAVVAVLLIACANLANLQLARGVARARELATRAAIGASRSDIVAQLVLESTWLALGGLVLGAVLTAWGIRIVDAFVPPTISDYVTHPQVSWRVMLFAVGTTVLCLVLVGLAPAITLSRVDINQLLKSGAGTGRPRSARRKYGVLVITEVALALSLLASAGLLVKAALVVHAFDYSWDFKGLIGTRVRVSRERPTDLRTRRDWSERLVQQALRVDSITGAATSIGVRPRTRTVSAYDVAGQPVSRSAPFFWYQLVSPDFFRVSRIPIAEGRDFSPGEFAEPQVIVDRTAANSLWPGISPVGKQIKLDSAHARSPWYRVVGVAEPVREYFQHDQDYAALHRAWIARTADSRFHGEIYVLNAADTEPLSGAVSASGWSGEFFHLLVRGRGDSRRLPMLLSRSLAGMGPHVTFGYPQTWEQSTGIARIRARHDFVASLFATFALFALALAALGVYAIIAHMVAQRTREFGVRIAVGAGEGHIRELVMREGNILSLTGIAVGLILTYYTAGFVRAFVFSDWDRYDSRVFAVVAAILFLVAWLASYLPARRAMRTNPVEALRND